MHKLAGFANEFAYVLPSEQLAEFAKMPALANLYVTDLGYYPHAAHHYVDRAHGTAEWIMILCTAGLGHVHVDGHDFTLSRGRVILLPPHVAHTYFASAQAPWDIFWVHCRGDLVSAFLPGDGVYFRSELNEADLSELTQRFWQMLQTLAGGYSEQSELFVSTMLANIFSYLRLRDQRADFQRVVSNPYVTQAIQQIYANLAKPLRVNALAAELNISASYLNRLFKQVLNKSVATFVTEIRIKQACHYLQFTDLPIQAIAAQVGYEDPLYFSRVFKQFMHRSPRNFRQQA